MSFLYVERLRIIGQLSVAGKIALSEKDKGELDYILKSEVATSSVETGVQQELISEMNKYRMYRNNYAMNIVFDPTKADLSEYVYTLHVQRIR